jgi:hypothetical protein
MSHGWFVETPEEQQAVAEMEAAADRPAAIVIASLVESRLTSAIQAAMVNLPELRASFFRADGPLGNFGTKIDLARLAGLLSEDAHNDLHIVRKIRNEFAHRLVPTSFDKNDRVRDLARQFALIETMVCDMEAKEEPQGFNFSLRVVDYELLKSLPRGRYMLTGRLFSSGLDKSSHDARFTFGLDPWL